MDRSGRGLQRIRGALHKHLPPTAYVSEPTEMLGLTYRVMAGEHAGRVGVCINTRDNWPWQKAVRLRFDDWLVRGFQTDANGDYLLDADGLPLEAMVPVTAPVYIGYLQALEEEGR
jgi:hypothetical protein